jgi:hypothetical protein
MTCHKSGYVLSVFPEWAFSPVRQGVFSIGVVGLAKAPGFAHNCAGSYSNMLRDQYVMRTVLDVKVQEVAQ